MKIYVMNGRFWGLFLVVLVVGFGGVGSAFALDCEFVDQVVSDTIECEHSWDGENLPECLQVEALKERSLWKGRVVEGRNCDYSAALVNHCAEAYVVSFECVGTRGCPESLVLEVGEDAKVDFSFDMYHAEEGGAIDVLFSFVDVSGEESRDDLDREEVRMGGVFTGGHSGEAVFKRDSGEWCKEGFFCQVTSMRRPVGGFVGFAVMVLGLMGFVWRRRVVG